VLPSELAGFRAFHSRRRRRHYVYPASLDQSGNMPVFSTAEDSNAFLPQKKPRGRQKRPVGGLSEFWPTTGACDSDSSRKVTAMSGKAGVGDRFGSRT